MGLRSSLEILATDSADEGETISRGRRRQIGQRTSVSIYWPYLFCGFLGMLICGICGKALCRISASVHGAVPLGAWKQGIQEIKMLRDTFGRNIR